MKIRYIVLNEHVPKIALDVQITDVFRLRGIVMVTMIVKIRPMNLQSIVRRKVERALEICSRVTMETAYQGFISVMVS